MQARYSEILHEGRLCIELQVAHFLASKSEPIINPDQLIPQTPGFRDFLALRVWRTFKERKKLIALIKICRIPLVNFFKSARQVLREGEQKHDY